MQLASLIINILSVVILFIIGWFIKDFFPSYMGKKGENLATKEDIAEITKRTEEVQKDFKERFELFSSDVKFKYDFFYKQYSVLYCKLYSIIVQSEYIRAFMIKYEGKTISFDEAPFLEMSPTHRMTQRIELKPGSPLMVSGSEELIETPISHFNKSQLCDLIIQNDSLASQELLKLAVSYRFAQNYYSGNNEVKNSPASPVADEEEFRLIRLIVSMIVRDYNQLRKELKMSYDEEELSSGIPHI